MKVFLETIGCRLNQSEIEKLAMQFRAQGYEITAEAAEADIVVVNTCAVTASASADSRKKIRAAACAGKAIIAATGCYATIDPEAVSALPAVEWLIPNNGKKNLVSVVTGSAPIITRESMTRQPLPGIHRRTRAFIKVQDGCDNSCTFCITRIARGVSRSQSESEIYEDIHSALEGSAKEIVLTGVNLGAWGRDLSPQKTLAFLVRSIIEKISPPRLRLSSFEPWDIDSDFFQILELPGFCPHIHLPLQSGSDVILKKMGRRISTGEFRSVIEMLRQIRRDIAITTDVMVGFPGESEEDFNSSLDFVKNMKFAGGHVFNFSARPGTAAEKLPDQIPVSIRKIRSTKLREVINQSASAYRTGFIGRELSVLWERSSFSNGYWHISGLSDNYLRVESRSKNDLYNTISLAEIIDSKKLVLEARDII